MTKGQLSAVKTALDKIDEALDEMSLDWGRPYEYDYQTAIAQAVRQIRAAALESMHELITQDYIKNA